MNVRSCELNESPNAPETVKTGEINERNDYTYTDCKFDYSFRDSRGLCQGFWDIYRHNSFLSPFLTYTLYKPPYLHVLEIVFIHLVLLFCSLLLYNDLLIEAISTSDTQFYSIIITGWLSIVSALVASWLITGVVCFLLRPLFSDFDAATTVVTYLSMTEIVYNSEKLQQRLNVRKYFYFVLIILVGVSAAYYGTILLNVYLEETANVLIIILSTVVAYHLVTPFCLFIFHIICFVLKKKAIFHRTVRNLTKFIN